MKKDNRQASFKQEKLLSIFKGEKVEFLVDSIKNSFRMASNQQKHLIRQRIFESQIMKNTKFLSFQTKAIHNHTIYPFLDEFQAVILFTCQTYHSIHIRYFAEQISDIGEYECKQCKTKCMQTKDIVVDGLLHAFYEKINNYQGNILIFKKREIGEFMRASAQQQAQQSKNKTIVVERNKAVLIEVKILQIVKDQSLQNLQIEGLFLKLEQAKGAESQQFKRKYLANSSVPILTNSICFSSYVRIRNPLIHKKCVPSTHANKLILYSYQNIFRTLFAEEKQKRVNCKFHGCQNYFSKENFEQNAIVIQEIQRGCYEQKRQNFMGVYFMKIYYKNWQIQLAEEQILQKQASSQKINLLEIRSLVGQLINTTNLKQGVNKSNKLMKKLMAVQSSALKLVKEYDGVISVSLGRFNACPVRCGKCGSLDSLDIYLAAYLFNQRKQKKCPLCLSEIKKKQFYQVYFVDLQLMQFIYLHGFAGQIYYDIAQKRYFHKMQHFTTSSLRQKLKKEKRSINWQGYTQTNIKLNKNHKYLVVVDSKCKSKSSQVDLIKHFCFISEQQELGKHKCKECGTLLRLDRLLICQQLEQLLKKGTNEFITRVKLNDSLADRKSILSLKHYADIEKQYKISKDEIYKFYWKNQQGGLLKYPIFFKRCSHSFETKLCDFADILYQIRTFNLKRFKCRFMNCQNQYQDADQILRLELEIGQIVESDDELKSRMLRNDEFWVTYSYSKKIIATSNRMKPEINQADQFQQRNKYRSQFNTIYNEINHWQLLSSIRKIEELIFSVKTLLADCQKQQIVKSQSDKSYLLKLKLSLLQLQHKEELLVKKQKQGATIEIKSGYNKSNKANIFQSIIRKFPNQLKKLVATKQNSTKLAEAVISFQNVQTQGNLFLVPYPVRQQRENHNLTFIQNQIQKFARKE